MSRSPPTNQQILRRLRYSQELHHRTAQECFSGLYSGPGLLTLPLRSPIPRVDLDHIQHSYNKSVAIYTITPISKPCTLAYVKDFAIRNDMIFTIYDFWFLHHNIDIDFGNFPIKMIRIENPFTKQRPGIANIISKHKAWCNHVETMLPLCAVKIDEMGREIDEPAYIHGNFWINRKQNQYFNLRPLFRALIIIVDYDASPLGEEKKVHLIRTNLPARISAPICFSGITPKLTSDRSSDYQGEDIITTTLSAAMTFITALESREAKAFPRTERDLSVIDEVGGDLGHSMRVARDMGYTGPELKEASRRWIEPEEGEGMRKPRTPLVMSMEFRVFVEARDRVERLARVVQLVEWVELGRWDGGGMSGGAEVGVSRLQT